MSDLRAALRERVVSILHDETCDEHAPHAWSEHLPWDDPDDEAASIRVADRLIEALSATPEPTLDAESQRRDEAHAFGYREGYRAALAATPEPTLDAERPTNEEVEAELHRVLCQNAKHRSRFTGECRAAPNIARGLRARLHERTEPQEPGL